MELRVIDLFDRGARLFPDRLCLTGEGGNFSYAEVEDLSHRVAAALARDGYNKGNRFSVYSPNCSEAMIAILGGYRGGLIWCNLNARSAIEDNIDLLQRNECEILFYHSAFAGDVEALRQGVPSLKKIIHLDAEAGSPESLKQFIKNVTLPAPFVDISSQDITIHMSTGGTTGKPKIVCQPARTSIALSASLVSYLGHTVAPVFLLVAPVTHAAGQIAIGLFPIGATIVMSNKTDPEAIMANIERFRATLTFLPPTLIYMMIAHPRAQEYKFNSMTHFIFGGAPMSPDKLRQAVEIFGPVMMQVYGQSENGLPITCMTPAEITEAVHDPDLTNRLSSCGRQSTVCRVEVMDENGNFLGPGETGELVCHGPMVMHSYYKDPQATLEIKTHGWQHTGDMGYRDKDGYFYICDRKRDMIVSGGFNIFPYEIEQVLLQHDAVQDCAVVGVPDDKWGEAVKAVIELKPGTHTSEKDILDHCRDRLGGMKTPKSVEIWESLPRSVVGKVLKREVRDKFWDKLERKVH